MRKTGILARMMRAVTFMRSTSCIVISALLLLVIQPALARAQGMPHAKIAEQRSRPRPSNVEAGISERLNRALGEVVGLKASAPGEDAGPQAARLQALRQRLEGLDREVEARFDAVDALVKSAGLPPVIQGRQGEARHEYRDRMKELLDGLSAAGQAGAAPEEQARALKAASTLARSARDGRPHQALDPERLPVNRPKGPARNPAVTPEEFQTLFKDLKVDVKAARQPASVAAAKVAPQPADLQPNEDVQITPEVTSLATQLGNNPLAIYNWVHDNVELVPTYGSIQGSRMTLLAKRGNASDIASLLIALLRASSIPARYVVGTVQVPVSKLSNWLGGTESPTVSQQLLGQGGIPNVGLLQGGQMTHVRVEHVWVEAWVDYVPGRGTRPGPGDTWVPLDASFKQHQIQPPNGVLENTPFDMGAFSNAFLQGAQVDPQLGSVVGIDPSRPMLILQDYQEQQQAYAQATSKAFNRDAMLGKQEILASGAKVLPASLPYELVVRASAPSVLPASLRASVTLNGFASRFDQALGDPAYSYQISLPALNSRRLGITAVPATDADAQTLQAARANNASSLPLYLINVKPVITLDGAAVATGPAVRMGSFLPLDVV
ncbi:MAG: transglutaminase family protein, partial [Thermoanaerobaculia bacterium]